MERLWTRWASIVEEIGKYQGTTKGKWTYLYCFACAARWKCISNSDEHTTRQKTHWTAPGLIWRVRM